LQEINRIGKIDLQVVIHKLLYTKYDDEIVKEYAEKSYTDLKETIQFLNENKGMFPNIKHIGVVPDSRMYAWNYREILARQLNQYDFQDNEFVFCSEGVYPVLREIMKGKKAQLIPIKNISGGSVDFMTSITSQDIISKIKELKLEDIKISKVYLPNSMYWIPDVNNPNKKNYDITGQTSEEITNKFPEIKIELVDILFEIINAPPMTLTECCDYYTYVNEPASDQGKAL